MGEASNSETIKKKSTFREYAEALVIAILLALFIRTFIVQAFKIPSGSMKPTLLIGDHILVNKFIYGIKMPFTDKILFQVKSPQKGDIVVFKWPKDENKDFIKRVVGIAGDKIEIENDILSINGKKIEKEYIDIFRDEEIHYAKKYSEVLGSQKHDLLDQYERGEDYGPVVIPNNSIFVMGDNRDNSQDSRYWGFVKLNKLKGKAMIIYWSWPNFKRFLTILH